MNIEKVMVVGSGLMGSGICQVCAQAGMAVFLNDISREALDKALENIAWSPTGGVTPATCLINEVMPNQFFEASTGRVVHSGNLKSVIWGCSGSLGVVGGSREAKENALDETLSFLQRNLM